MIMYQISFMQSTINDRYYGFFLKNDFMLNKNTAENETRIKSTTSVDKANKIWS